MNFSLYKLVPSTHTHAIIDFLKPFIHLTFVSNFNIIFLLHFLEKTHEFYVPVSKSSPPIFSWTHWSHVFLLSPRATALVKVRNDLHKIKFNCQSSVLFFSRIIPVADSHIFWNTFTWLPGQLTLLGFPLPHWTFLRIPSCFCKKYLSLWTSLSTLSHLVVSYGLMVLNNT